MTRTLTPPDMICFALYSAAHAMQQAYKPHLDGMGITYPQYLVLTVLWAGDDQTVGAIGRQVQLDSNTLTPLLKRLQVQGIVERLRDAQDERQVRIRLTEKGRALADQAARIPDCILDRSGLTMAEAAALRDRVTALRDHLRGAGG
jgi:DNA-binding MarR family transcriptional regulator